MNFLAHLVLSCGRDHLMLGNFLGDFLSNSEVAQLPPSVAAGVALHRQIDMFTDNHPLVREGVARLRPRHGKYAPVVIDVFFDYILSKQWERLSLGKLEDFHKKSYQLLADHIDMMPLWLRPQVQDMVQAGWLRQYGSVAGIEDTFRRMRYRVTRPDLLDGVGESLQEQEPLLTLDFIQFFPGVMDFTKNWVAKEMAKEDV
jgi:acyl carrier protein phosphodiesterase